MADMLGEAFVVVRATMSRLRADLQGVGPEITSILGKTLGRLSHTGKLTAVGLAAGAAFTLASKATAEWNANIQEGAHLADQMTAAQIRLRATIATTGNSAGFSKKQLAEYAESLDDAIAGDKSAIIEAQSRLLAFRTIQGDTFKRATIAAADLAAKWQMSVPQAATTLGRALNDPVRGIGLLRRMNVQLSESEQQLVKDMVEVGKVAKAQETILKAVDQSVGGFAKGIVTPLARLKDDLEDIREEIGLLRKQREPITLRFQIEFARFHLAFEQGRNRALGIGGPNDPRQIGGTPGSSLFGRVFGGGLGAIQGGFSALLNPENYPDWMGGRSGRSIADQSLFNARFGRMPRLPNGRFGMPATEDFMDSIRAKGKASTDDQTKLDKEKAEGIFGPLELAKRMQEAMLGKRDEMLDLQSAGNALLGQIAFNTQKGAGEQSIPIAGPA